MYYVCSFSTFKLSTMVLVQNYVIGELMGHAGFEPNLGKGDAGSFARMFTNKMGLSLRAVHHDYHHQKCGTNYGKRLCLWDKVFGTHYNPKIANQSRH